MELHERMFLQEDQQSDVEIHRGLCYISDTVPGVRERGCIARERLQDLQLNSDYLKWFQDLDFQRFFTSFGL